MSARAVAVIRPVRISSQVERSFRSCPTALVVRLPTTALTSLFHGDALDNLLLDINHGSVKYNSRWHYGIPRYAGAVNRDEIPQVIILHAAFLNGLWFACVPGHTRRQHMFLVPELHHSRIRNSVKHDTHRF